MQAEPVFGQRLAPYARAEMFEFEPFERDVNYNFGILIRDEGYSDEQLIEMAKSTKLGFASLEKIILKLFELREVICLD